MHPVPRTTPPAPNNVYRDGWQRLKICSARVSRSKRDCTKVANDQRQVQCRLASLPRSGVFFHTSCTGRVPVREVHRRELQRCRSADVKQQTDGRTGHVTLFTAVSARFRLHTQTG